MVNTFATEIGTIVDLSVNNCSFGTTSMWTSAFSSPATARHIRHLEDENKRLKDIVAKLTTIDKSFGQKVLDIASNTEAIVNEMKVLKAVVRSARGPPPTSGDSLHPITSFSHSYAAPTASSSAKQAPPKPAKVVTFAERMQQANPMKRPAPPTEAPTRASTPEARKPETKKARTDKVIVIDDSTNWASVSKAAEAMTSPFR